jgi:allophanate hydrolase
MVLEAETRQPVEVVEDVAAVPILRNSNLGRFSNLVNLPDADGIAVPAGFRKNGQPFGVTLLAPAFAEGF